MDWLCCWDTSEPAQKVKRKKTSNPSPVYKRVSMIHDLPSFQETFGQWMGHRQERTYNEHHRLVPRMLYKDGHYYGSARVSTKA
jgi:hypothetical protein